MLSIIRISFFVVCAQILCAQSSSQIGSEINALIKEAPFTFPEMRVPEFPGRDFPVSGFGAIGDGVTLNTVAIQKSLDACSQAGGGRVVVPQGLWLTGPLELRENTNLHLQRGAVLVFSNDHTVFQIRQTSSKSFEVPPPISARGVKNIAITGEGIIDGNGKGWRPVKRFKYTESQWRDLVKSGGVVNEKGDMWWPNPAALNAEKFLASKKKGELTIEDMTELREFNRPHMVMMEKCSNILLDEITLQNSPKFATYIRGCNNIIVRNVKVRNEWSAQNGDGLDFSSCKNLIIYGCTVNAGDDGICMKSSGKPVPENVLENVIIADCYVYHGHGGVVFGSNTDGGMRNVFVKRCTFMLTDTGLRFKSGIGRGGTVEKVFIEDITMKDIEEEAIIFDLVYSDAGSVKMPGDKTDTAKYPLYREIAMKNIYCIGAESFLLANSIPASLKGISIENGVFQCRKGADLRISEQFTLKNISLYIGEGPAFTISGCSGITFDAVRTNAEQFLVVDGPENNQIILTNPEPTEIMKSIQFTRGALPGSVTVK